MVDEYIQKYRKAVKNAKNNEEIDTVLNKLYEDGLRMDQMKDNISHAKVTDCRLENILSSTTLFINPAVLYDMVINYGKI